MTAQLVLYFVVLLGLAWPLGRWIQKALTGSFVLSIPVTGEAPKVAAE